MSVLFDSFPSLFRVHPTFQEFESVLKEVMKGVQAHTQNLTMGVNNLAVSSVRYELCCDQKTNCDCSGKLGGWQLGL